MTLKFSKTIWEKDFMKNWRVQMDEFESKFFWIEENQLLKKFGWISRKFVIRKTVYTKCKFLKGNAIFCLVSLIRIYYLIVYFSAKLNHTKALPVMKFHRHMKRIECALIFHKNFCRNNVDFGKNTTELLREMIKFLAAQDIQHPKVG